MDPLLAPLLHCADALAADQLIGELLRQHATPLIVRIVARRIGSATPDAEDVCAQVLLQLLVRLRQQRADATLAGIDGFNAYVATTARHACDHYLRARYPLQWRLRNRIVYVLAHDPRFAAWTLDGGTWACGRDGWQPAPLAASPSTAAVGAIPVDDIRTLLQRVFELSGGPLELQDVVNIAATAWNIPRHHLAADVDVQLIPHPAPRPDDSIDQRERLERVWAQVRDLPLRQRQALLLNLRDDALALFLTTGAATLRDIAAALELAPGEFATLWNHLPLPDLAIAERLTCTRQQVINLRMAARKRLGHRLAAGS